MGTKTQTYPSGKTLEGAPARSAVTKPIAQRPGRGYSSKQTSRKALSFCWATVVTICLRELYTGLTTGTRANNLSPALITELPIKFEAITPNKNNKIIETIKPSPGISNPK